MTVLCPLWIFSVTLDWVVEAYKMLNHVDVTLQLEKHIQVYLGGHRGLDTPHRRL